MPVPGLILPCHPEVLGPLAPEALILKVTTTSIKSLAIGYLFLISRRIVFGPDHQTMIHKPEP
jgi:hypothetical protein